MMAGTVRLLVIAPALAAASPPRPGCGGGGGGSGADDADLAALPASALGAPKHFALSMTVGELKRKLEMIVGTAPADQALALRVGDGDENGAAISRSLDDDAATLADCGARDDARLVVRDTAADGGVAALLADDGSVKKYELSDAEYDARKNTYRAWKREQQQQQQAAAAAGGGGGGGATDADGVAVRVGARVRTLDGRDGAVAFVGATQFAPGTWIGVCLDSADGKNDGSVKGERYFTCEPRHGAFVRGAKLRVVVAAEAAAEAAAGTGDDESEDEI